MSLFFKRSARGVRPTAAGEILFKEASAILHQLDQLPGVVRSSSGEPEGLVRLGFSGALAPKLVGGVLDECRTVLPKVTIRISDGDSFSLEDKIASAGIDLALLYEDDFVAPLTRTSPVHAENVPCFPHSAARVQGCYTARSGREAASGAAGAAQWAPGQDRTCFCPERS